MTTLMVAAGGMIGVMGRYGLTRLTIHHESLFWMTAAINIGGSFVLGVLTAASWFSRDVREGSASGCSAAHRAAAYVAVSVVGGIAAAVAGYALGRRLA